jgi:hypothetical protein
MAQVFKPQEDFLGEAMKAAEAKKKESAANKSKAMETLGKMAEYHVWTERDGAEFAKKQKEVWDGLSGRDLDDPNTMLWLNQKQQELTYLADRSNTDKDFFKNATNLYATKPTKYLDETLTNLQEFASPNNALGVNKSWNPAYMVERADLDGDLKKLADLGRSRAEARKQKLASVRTIPGSTEPYTVETTTTEYSLPEAEQDIRIQMQEPSWRKTVNERWQTDPNRDKYKTVDEYAQFELAPKIASKSYLEDATRVPGEKGFGGGAGGFTPGGWGVEETKTEAPVLNEQQINTAIQSRIADPSAKKNYDYLLEQDKIPYITTNGKQRQMTFDEFEEDLVRKSQTAQSKEVGAVYNFGRASKTGEATEIKYMEITSGDKKGVQFKPTQIIIKKNREPIFSGLDPNDNKIEIPYSELSGKLRVETGGDWDLLREKIAKEQGFDPFAPYEPKKPSSGTTTGGAKAIESDYTNITKTKDSAGNIMTLGVKNGKWYDINTGKEIK